MSEEDKNLKSKKRISVRKIGLSLVIINVTFGILLYLGGVKGRDPWAWAPFFGFFYIVGLPLTALGVALVLLDFFSKNKRENQESNLNYSTSTFILGSKSSLLPLLSHDPF